MQQPESYMEQPTSFRRTIVAIGVSSLVGRFDSGEVLRPALAELSIDWDVVRKVDRGDDLLIVVPPAVSADVLASQLPSSLTSVMLRYHEAHGSARVRLRVALDLVDDDRLDLSGPAVEHVMRLVEVRSAGVLTLVASDTFYRNVIVLSSAAEPDSYQQIDVSGESGWLRLLEARGPIHADLDIDLGELDEPAAALLVRSAALLDHDEPLDTGLAAVLLPGEDPATVDRALSDLEDRSWMARMPTGEGLGFSDWQRREFAASRFTTDTDAQVVEELRWQLRRHRVVQVGISPKTKLIRDYWTTDDLLGYRAYAEAVAAFIRHRDSQPPLTIGVKGSWGAGKTSLMRMVRAELDLPENGQPRPIELTSPSRMALTRWQRRPSAWADTPVTNGELLRHSTPSGLADTLEVEPPATEWRATVWFNPWMYQSSEQVWAGLAHAIISQVTDRLRPGDRERFWLELNLARVDRLAIRRRVYRLILERLGRSSWSSSSL